MDYALFFNIVSNPTLLAAATAAIAASSFHYGNKVSGGVFTAATALNVANAVLQDPAIQPLIGL